METIYSWFEDHTAICTWLGGTCTLLTFVLTFIFKKKSSHSQNISNIRDSTINQANGNITINSQNDRQE